MAEEEQNGVDIELNITSLEPKPTKKTQFHEPH